MGQGTRCDQNGLWEGARQEPRSELCPSQEALGPHPTSLKTVCKAKGTSHTPESSRTLFPPLSQGGLMLTNGSPQRAWGRQDCVGFGAVRGPSPVTVGLPAEPPKHRLHAGVPASSGDFLSSVCPRGTSLGPQGEGVARGTPSPGPQWHVLVRAVRRRPLCLLPGPGPEGDDADRAR